MIRTSGTCYDLLKIQSRFHHSTMEIVLCRIWSIGPSSGYVDFVPSTRDADLILSSLADHYGEVGRQVNNFAYGCFRVHDRIRDACSKPTAGPILPQHVMQIGCFLPEVSMGGLPPIGPYEDIGPHNWRERGALRNHFAQQASANSQGVCSCRG